jgi:hypothetical protein
MGLLLLAVTPFFCILTVLKGLGRRFDNVVVLITGYPSTPEVFKKLFTELIYSFSNCS